MYFAYFAITRLLAGAVLVVCTVAAGQPSDQGMPQNIDLIAHLARGKLQSVGGREVTKAEGRADGVHLSKGPGTGVVWLEGSDFGEGTIEVDIRGRDLLQQSFVGIAFHRKDEDSYEVVYLRPFNFRSEDPVRRQHAVQYMALPDYRWSRLRKEFPEEFENPVDASLEPNDWVPLRVVVKSQTVEIYVGRATSPTLEVRKLGQHDRGMIGLWADNNSDGAFANLRITPAK